MAFVYDECVLISFYKQLVRKLIVGIVFYNIFGGIQDCLKALSE